MGISERLRHEVDPRSDGARTAKAVRLTAVPLGIGALSMFLVQNNDQIRDLVLTLLEDWTEARWRVLWAVVDLGLLVACLGFVSHWILRTALVPKYGESKKMLVSDRVAKSIPFVAASMPAIGWFGLLFSLMPSLEGDLRGRAWLLVFSSALAVFLAFCIFWPPKDEVAAASDEGLSPDSPKTSPLEQGAQSVRRTKRSIYTSVGKVYLFSTIAMVWGGVAFAVAPYKYGTLWGPLANFFIGLAAYALFLGGLAQLSERKRLPLLYVFIVPAILVHMGNCQRHREIRLVEAADAPATLENQFTDWLDSRPNREAFRGDAYPVVVVAAQGGGIRAAALTALTLAKLDAMHPGFSDHVFLISGVSGGAVGAGFYAATIAQERGAQDQLPPRIDRLRKTLRQDYLSGPLGRLFFTDAITMWAPLPRVTSLDRSDALSASFRDGAGDAAPLLGKPLSFFTGQAPFLALNTSSVGRTSPFVLTRLQTDFAGSRLAGLDSLGSRDYRYEISLSDAMGLSSRFPGITSAGILRSPTGRTVALVDGGYFDNSGLGTALAFMDRLTQVRLKDGRKVRFLILRIGSKIDADDPASGDQWIRPLPSFTELLSPLYTAMGVYSSQVLGSPDRIQRWIESLKGRGEAVNAVDVESAEVILDFRYEVDRDNRLPLGWSLSGRSIDLILQAIGHLDAPEGRPTVAALRARNQAQMERLTEFLRSGKDVSIGKTTDTLPVPVTR